MVHVRLWKGRPAVGLESVKATRSSIRVTSNKPIVIVYGGLADWTFPRHSPFHLGDIFKPGSAFLAVKLSSEDDTQPRRRRHFCAVGRKRARSRTHPRVRGKKRFVGSSGSRPDEGPYRSGPGL